VLGRVAAGEDPAEAKQDARDTATVRQVVERFLREHAEAKRKSTTASEYRRLLEAHILPAFGPRPIAAITRADVAKLHHRLKATPMQANRVLAVLSKMMNLAERWGLRPDATNPCRHVERYREGTTPQRSSGPRRFPEASQPSWAAASSVRKEKGICRTSPTSAEPIHPVSCSSSISQAPWAIHSEGQAALARRRRNSPTRSTGYFKTSSPDAPRARKYGTTSMSV
jgi:hypothetical protein